ncbi:MAG: tetratricopeptide repeat protein [Anaerolineales bacterium]
MDRDLVGKKPHYRPAKNQVNPYRIMLWISLILLGVWMLMGIRGGRVEPLFEATPTPTRTAGSYVQEAQAYFQAGKLDDPDAPLPTPPRPDAIDTYQRALDMDPNNAQAWAEKARIQTYSITMLSNDADRLERLEQALESINTAVELNPDDSSVHAIRAFVLDWYASSPLVTEERRQELLLEAEGEAVRAYGLDPENGLALAFYAEVLLDQQKWSQAEQNAAKAITIAPDSMDAHRVYATVLESLGQYRSAIEQYLKAAEISPNLTFLYVYVGRNYLSLRLYDRALEYYARAAEINKQLGVQNPIPNLEIAKTYTQQGEFFIAARNAETALSFDPTNANTYGQLGIIYIRSRNYEGAQQVLKCAVRGCTAQENEVGEQDVQGLQLTNLTVAYYYVEYGTVLAFLSRPNQNFCPEARQVLNEVRAAYPDDEILMTIVADSEGICSRLDSGIVPEETLVETPEMMEATPVPGSP